MKKKINLLFLCFIIMFCLCGCNQKENNESVKKDNVINQEQLKEEDNTSEKKDNNINTNDKIKEDSNKKEESNTTSNNKNNSNTTINDKKEENIDNTTTNNGNNNTNDKKEENKENTTNNNSNNNNNENVNEEAKPSIPNIDTIEPIQEEITITSSNLYEYFEIKREDIIPEINAFGERGTEEDFYYELLLSLKNTYKQKLVSANISVEFASETYLRSFSYNRQTGIGTVTNEYRRFYNNTDKFLCNIKNNSSCYITTCHIAGSEYINDKLIYYAYITEKLEPIRVGGSIILKK